MALAPKLALEVVDGREDVRGEVVDAPEFQDDKCRSDCDGG
jgi:hypothetical protein